MTDDQIDAHLDAILRASGSALKHFTLAKPKEDMRAALRAALAAPGAAEPVAWCALSIDGKHIAYFDGKPMVMPGRMGNDCHPFPLYAGRAPTERDAVEAEPEIGDYVLATKWSDGDPGDAWAVGFYAGIDSRAGLQDRHMVHNLDGSNIRPNGFRSVRLIPADVGAWLLKHAAVLESAPPGSLDLLKAVDTGRNSDPENVPARAALSTTTGRAAE